MASLAMGLNPLSKFKGPDAVTPVEGTLAYDEETNDIYQAHYVDDEWRWFSRTAEIQKFLDNLSASGLFEASAAFVNNRKILRFYYDPDNGVVRLNPDLRFDESYRYYAIRSISKSSDGSYDYITGEASSDGSIIASLVTMDLVDSVTADGTKVSKPGTGKLYGDVIDGNAYIVEYYDINRNLIDMESYQAVKVRTADTDLCPDTAVKDLLVHCNQESNGAFFLHQGQSVDELAIQVLLDYGDDLLKDISHEETNGGRLAISGLDEIDTSTLTSESGSPQKIVVSYTMVRSNTSYATTSSYTTDTGAIVAPSSNTIYKEIEVNIVANDNTDLVDVIPVGYVIQELITTESGSKTYNNRMKFKFFGHYSDGSLYDITNLASITSGAFDDESFGSTQEMTVQIRLGYSSYTYKTYTFTVISPDQTSIAAGTRRVSFSSTQVYNVKYDTGKTAGGVYSGSFTGFMVTRKTTTSSDSSEGETTSSTMSPSELVALDDAKYNGIEPNYIRIRDVADPTFYYTDIVQPSNSIYYTTNSEHPISKDTPLLVEFYRVTIDSTSNKTINTFITGAMAFFATPASSS